MKKINDWVIRTFGLRGSWSWAKKQMLNGAIIKRKATIGTYKIAIDNDKNRLLVATWDHLDQSPVWERCPHSLLDEDAVDYFVTAHKGLSYGGIKIRMKDELTRQKNMRRRMIGGQTVSNGIYILHTNGKLYTSDKWNYSWRNDAVGVALISDNSSFVISGIELKNRSWSNTTGLIQGVTTITSSNEAKKDFNGFQNTQSIAEYTHASAAYECTVTQFKNGQMGYLASVGEWMEIINNLDEINRCMSLIDGLDIDEGTTSYWTSTQYNSEKAWLMTYNGNEFYPNDERKIVSFYAIRVISQLK